MGLLGGYAETPEEAAAIEARDRAYYEAHEAAEACEMMSTRIAELEETLRNLVAAVKAGEAVSGAEAMGAAEAALTDQNRHYECQMTDRMTVNDTSKLDEMIAYFEQMRQLAVRDQEKASIQDAFAFAAEARCYEHARDMAVAWKATDAPQVKRQGGKE